MIGFQDPLSSLFSSNHSVRLNLVTLFGVTVQDADGDTSITVTSSKGDNRALCHRCFYIGRGSLGKLKMIDLVKLLKKSTALRKKFLSGKIIIVYSLTHSLTHSET